MEYPEDDAWQGFLGRNLHSNQLESKQECTVQACRSRKLADLVGISWVTGTVLSEEKSAIVQHQTKKMY